MGQHLGLPVWAFAAALSQLEGMTPKKLRIALLHEEPEDAWARAVCDSTTSDEVVARIFECCGREKIEVVYIGDPNYPRALRYDPTPPAVLFYRGSLSALQQRRVGIVGTRSPTPSGVYTAREFGEQLAANEIAVVSGLARGIDGAVHHGMKLHYEEVAYAGHGALGKPIGVVACGLDVVYPKSNAGLWEWVGENGLLLSEYGPGVQPEPYRFPQRNRIIAALSEVVVVVESRESGGSMLTVAEAIRRNIEVFAVPGSPRVASAGGTNLLIQQGCGPVTSVDDLFAALALDHRRESGSSYETRVSPDAHDHDVLLACTDGAVTLDHLVLLLNRPLHDIAVSLGRLEALGWVVDTNGWWEALMR